MNDKKPAAKNDRPKSGRLSAEKPAGKTGKNRPDRVKKNSRVSLEKPPKPQK